MQWKLGYGTIGLLALLLCAGLVFYNYQNAPLEVPLSIAYTDPSELTPYPELQGVTFSINEATVAQLKLLPGIGEKKATAIYNYVRQRGRIRNLRELLNVEGIGEQTLENISPYLTL